MPDKSSHHASIEQTHRDVAAFLEEMRKPQPNAVKASLISFSIGAVFALVTIVVMVWLSRLL